MSNLADLKAAGFSDDEVAGYASQQRQTLAGAGFSDAEITAHLGAPAPRPAPDTAAANKVFARTLGDVFSSVEGAKSAASQVGEGAMKTVTDLGSLYAPIEAALNAGTGLLFGFPAYVGGGLGGLVSKHLLGMDADPKELAETMSKLVTYQPQTERGIRLTGNVMMPLTKLMEGAEAGGHAVTDVAPAAAEESARHRAQFGTPSFAQSQPDTTERRAADVKFAQGAAPVLGAITDASIQMLTPLVAAELGRKMGGQTVGPQDMTNAAKVIAGTDAPPHVIDSVESSLQSVYSKTGIGPFTLLDAAKKDPQLRAELADPNVDVPSALQLFIPEEEKPAVAPEATSPEAPAFDPAAIPPETLAEHGLVDTPETRQQLTVIARAATIDPEAVARAALDFADNEPAFHQAIQDIIDEQENQSAGAGERGVGAGGEDAESGDLGTGGAEPGSAGSDQSYRAGAGTLNSGLDPEQAVKLIQSVAHDVTNGIVNSDIGREVVKSVMPMSSGSRAAQAVAQRFANAMRNARFQWQQISQHLEKTFTPEVRKAMWEAADEQNVLLMNGTDTAGKGLDRLTPAQRSVMEDLHTLANGLWQRAKDAGMVEGEGLPFWTPRMAVLIGEDGEFLRPGSEARSTSKGEGANVTTSASSLKQRKYTTAGETEEAMKGALGDNAQLVRDVMTMPLAMSRMSQAIAGRELISQLKELGQVAGKDIVSESPGSGFTTIDHPAFTTYRPEFVTGLDGKVTVRLDEDGAPVMQRVPMLISDEWAGPMKAVMSTTDGPIYKALMLAKSKAMAAIMISPAAHNMVIFGRALAYDPAAVASLKAYWQGHALAKDPVLMSRAISDGLVPIGANKGSMMDITDVARGIGREGGWGDPNQSWINLSAQKVANIFSEKAGDFVKAKMDAFGDFWHHTLLWKQVGALQTYIYNDYFNHLTALGHPPEVAGPIAANLANRYSGAVANENSSAWVRKALNVTLFSRSFNVGNVGAVHDAAFGMPSGLASKMRVEAGEGAAEAGLAAAAGKARMGLVSDLGMSMLMTAATSAAVMTLLQNQTVDDVASGYGRRLKDMVNNIGEHPLNPDSYNPYRVLPTWDNEPGKQDRIDLGAQPGGRHEYLRLPTGKVVEDTIGWMLHAPDTFVKKLSPTARALWESVTNDKGFGVPVEDPEGGVLKHIAQGIQHVMEAQVPLDTLKTLYDVSTGVGTPVDKDKLAGFASGFTTSQGNPRGPEEGAFYAQQDRVSAAKKYAMEEVKNDIKHGRDAEAFDRLRAVGLSPREIQQTINNIKNPRFGMSKQQARKFTLQANDEDRAAMENAARQQAQ